ncbi:hypothetical protein V495_06349 [Pseudogymnoascus sp. VKM F-4514 (FW-929)]|nr:hypothetical protein V495_06349 [Pseudogymnoascus sp. VKM F-4514 (FW-929)]KFY51411.1 hypothetical protein V497_09177 [Pseudogymnoascus sp. VKM F-4516 (FW-969)]
MKAASITQQKTEAVDKKFVGKLDNELALLFWEAFIITASKPQKRRFNGAESDGKRPAKITNKQVITRYNLEKAMGMRVVGRSEMEKAMGNGQ